MLFQHDDGYICHPEIWASLGPALRSGPYSINNMVNELDGVGQEYWPKVEDFISTTDSTSGALDGIHMPGIVGIGLDFSAQYVRDAHSGYSTWQRITRAGLVTAEGQGVSVISLVASGANGIGASETGPLDIAVIGATYALMNRVGSTTLDKYVNIPILFPLINNLVP